MVYAPASLTTTAYRPEWDAFRAGAVLLVILHHWWPGTLGDLGAVGVTGFFVLSGLLITNILRRVRVAGPVNQMLRVFFLRRSWRIMPAYYATLMLATLLNLSFVREQWPWFVAHGSNFVLYRHQAWGEGSGHFWTLAVEEQFYLIWPILVLIVPSPRLPALLFSLVVLAPLFRVSMLLLTHNPFVRVLLPANLDAFAIGGLLGLQLEKKPGRGREWLIAAIGGMGSYAGTFLLPSIWQEVLAPLLLALASAAVLAALYHTTGRLRQILTLTPLVFLGRISYSIYLYHQLVPVILYRLLYKIGSWLGRPLTREMLIQYTTLPGGVLPLFILLCMLAIPSWYLIEQPLQRFGQRWRY